jgi:hypothetical protein
MKWMFGEKAEGRTRNLGLEMPRQAFGEKCWTGPMISTYDTRSELYREDWFGISLRWVLFLGFTEYPNLARIAAPGTSATVLPVIPEIYSRIGTVKLK